MENQWRAVFPLRPVRRSSRVVGVEADSGVVRWSVPSPRSYDSPIVPLGAGAVAVGAEDGTVTALDAATGGRPWAVSTEGDVARVGMRDGSLLVVSEPGLYRALRAGDGRFSGHPAGPTHPAASVQSASTATSSPPGTLPPPGPASTASSVCASSPEPKRHAPRPQGGVWTTGHLANQASPASRASKIACARLRGPLVPGSRQHPARVLRPTVLRTTVGNGTPPSSEVGQNPRRTTRRAPAGSST